MKSNQTENIPIVVDQETENVNRPMRLMISLLRGRINFRNSRGLIISRE